MKRAVHWFRNDFRLRDNTALREAVRACDELVPLFVLDERLLAGKRSGSPRVRFMLDCVARLASTLEERGQRLVVRKGRPEVVVPKLLEEARADLLSFNREQTPYARRRDRRIVEAVEKLGRRVLSPKDRVVFESGEVLSQQGRPFAVYTPYRRAWQRRYEEEGPRPAQAPRLPGCGARLASDPLPAAEALGFAGETEIPTGGEDAAQRRLSAFLGQTVAGYHEQRDLPAVDGTSRLSPYLRFGVISPRDCVDKAREAAASDPRVARGAEKWIEELIWREFYTAILEEHPRITRESYRPEYDAVKWNHDEAGFQAWCEGRTGYPIVDAGMRQLAATGWMHNRVRMIVASFLTKDLLIDWRWGERFFYQRLVDGDPASNNGGWQWSAGTGTDAAPYFRIFNPTSQSQRYDPDGAYIRRWVPELSHVQGREIHDPSRAGVLLSDYPPPIVDHAERRTEALERYQTALGKKS